MAELSGHWIALIGWNVAVYHLKGREEWIGWTIKQRLKRRKFVVQNSRYLLLVDRGHWINLVSSEITRACGGSIIRRSLCEAGWHPRRGLGRPNPRRLFPIPTPAYHPLHKNDAALDLTPMALYIHRCSFNNISLFPEQCCSNTCENNSRFILRNKYYPLNRFVSIW